jgi:hypothetical protein
LGIQFSDLHCSLHLNSRYDLDIFVVAGVKVDETKKRKVCRDCLDKAEQSRSRMVQMLKNHQLIIEEKLPIPRESTVTLDDSDQV